MIRSLLLPQRKMEEPTSTKRCTGQPGMGDAVEPSTPLRQGGAHKQLFIPSPPGGGGGTRHAVGNAISQFLNSPAVTPPQRPADAAAGAHANPHLQEPVRHGSSDGPSVDGPAATAAAAAGDGQPAAAAAADEGLASCGELLRRAADTLADPTETMAEQIMAEAQRSMEYLQQLRDERAEHRRWFVETSEQHVAGRELAAQQLGRQRELRVLARCFSGLRVRVDRVARQRALAGWGRRSQRQLLHASWARWARHTAHWYRLARAFELTAQRCWCRTARLALRGWRQGIAHTHRDAVAARRAELRRLRRWFAQWAGQATRWASVHQGMERSARLALRQLECVSRRAIQRERALTARCTRAWRRWSHRRVVARRLVTRCTVNRARRAKAVVLDAWGVFAVHQRRHTALAWHAVSVGRGLQTSLLHWQRAARHQRTRRRRAQTLLATAATSSRYRALARTVAHLKRHARLQTRCHRFLIRARRSQTKECWGHWHATTMSKRRQALLLTCMGRKRRSSTLTVCLQGWRDLQRCRQNMRGLRRHCVCKVLRCSLRIWINNVEDQTLERNRGRRAAVLANQRMEIVIRRAVHRERVGLRRCLRAWLAAHEHCRQAQEQRLWALRVMQAKQSHMVLKAALGHWRLQTQRAVQIHRKKLEAVLRAWICWQSQLVRHHRNIAGQEQANARAHMQGAATVSATLAANTWLAQCFIAWREVVVSGRAARLAHVRVLSMRRKRSRARHAMAIWHHETARTSRNQLELSIAQLQATTMERAVLLRHMVAWSHLVYGERCTHHRMIRSCRQARRYQQLKRTFAQWAVAVADVHKRVFIASKIVRRVGNCRIQSVFVAWSELRTERSLQRIRSECIQRVSSTREESRQSVVALRARMVALSIAKSVRRLKHNALSLALGDWQRATRASLRGKVPLLQTAFEIERVALIKGTASSADDVWQAQISQLEEQRCTERARSADLLVDVQMKLAETEGQLYKCSAELQRMKEKYRRQQKKWEEKWDGFEQYRSAVRRKEAELAQKKQALREWSQQHMTEIKQFIAEHQVEKQSCSQAMQAAQQLECAAAESVAAKDDELSYAKHAAAEARRERAEAADRLVAAQALFRATATQSSAVDSTHIDAATATAGTAMEPVAAAGGVAVGGSLVLPTAGAADYVQGQVREALLQRSTKELISAREAEEAATLSLDYDIDSLLNELQTELRLPSGSALAAQ